MRHTGTLGVVNPVPNIDVLYEDNHVIVAVKPPNLLSQADDTGDMDMLTAIKQDLKIRHNKPGNVYLGLIHRLDRPVGGAMVFAKTSKAASRLSDTVRKRELGKEYIAVVHGVPASPHGTLKHTLLKDARTNTVRVVPPGTAGGKEAVLDYDVLGSAEGMSLVRIALRTGRPHQIRVQMKQLSCPLYGDQKYGAELNRPGQQLALWSRRLTFPHPVTKTEMEFYSTPPHEYPWTIWKGSILG